MPDVPGTDALLANVLPVEFPFTTFSAWRRPVVDGEDLAALREANRDRWHVQWESGHLYMLRLADDAPKPGDAELVELEVSESLRLLARLVTDALVRRFPTYEPLRQKPFVFLGRKLELMQDVGRALGLDHPLLGQFRVWPKYSLDGRVVEVRDDSPFVGITVDLATRWEITAGLQELTRSGVDLAGLYVLRRSPDPDQRRLVGRIASVGTKHVELAESTDDTTSVAIDEVMLEGRRDAFARCLSTLFGHRDYARYDAYRDQRMGELLGGPPLLQEMQRVARILAEDPLSLAAGLDCSVSPPLHITNTGRYKTVVPSRQLDYCFDPARSKRHRYAWPGLDSYGPFSRDTFAHPSPRLLVVFPPAAKGAVEAFVRSLRDGIPGQKGFAAGMAKTFGLVNPRFEFVPARTDAGRTPAENYRRAIETALAQGDLPDAALVVVTDRHGDLPEAQNPYLHSKAILLMAGVAAQEARLSTITRRPAELQYVLQNIAVALYAKMNGVPWTVDHDLTIADELVIGVGTAELSESRTTARQRYVGITTVFRGDGNYLLGQLSRESTYSDYPIVLRDSTRDVIEEVKKRNGWQPGDTVRLIFHAARPPRNVDFATLMRDAVDAVGEDLHVEFAFLTVSHDHPFALFDTSQPGKATPKGRKGEYAPDRGLIVQIGRYSRLINTSGVTLVKRTGLPLPRPLQVHLHRSSTFKDLHYLSEQVVKFTGLSWRSTQPAADPVTIYYSELIARLLGRLKAVPDWSPALLDARLRTSKWFI